MAESTAKLLNYFIENDTIKTYPKCCLVNPDREKKNKSVLDNECRGKKKRNFEMGRREKQNRIKLYDLKMKKTIFYSFDEYTRQRHNFLAVQRVSETERGGCFVI